MKTAWPLVWMIPLLAVLLLLPQQSQGGEFLLERSALNYDRATMAPDCVEKLKGAVNLAGNPEVKKPDRVLATFEYDLEIPQDGWYRIDVPGARGFEYDVDGTNYGMASDTAGSVYLKKGKHALLLKKQNYFNPWNPVEKIVIRAAGDSPLERLRISGVRFVHEAVVRKGEAYTLLIDSGMAQDTEVIATLTDRATKQTLTQVKCVLPASDYSRTTMDIPAQQTGIFDISFTVGGVAAQAGQAPPFRMLVMDTAPVMAKIGAALAKTLLMDIDCAQKEPDYAGGGDTRVIRKSFGAYRESGDVSWITHMNENEPSWFAYTIDVPEKNKQYVAEIDYPDDANRTYAIAVRNAGQSSYPVAGGVETGHDYRLSNTMRTHTLLFWAREKQARLVIANASDGHRGAAAKIRIYQLADEPMPMLANPQIQGRDFASWFEEGTCFVGLFGGYMQNASAKPVGDFMTSADRWAETMSYMGADTLYPTLLVYQFGLYPSDYNLFATRATTDLAEIILLAAEKYGMGVLFDFHPEARQLKWAMAGQENMMRSRSGAISTFAPMLGPLHPVNQDWLCGMIKEFAQRYKHSEAFKGISLRHMTWYNHALCNFNNLDWGYDDYTVGLFESETGITVPNVTEEDAGRFEKRYAFLTNHDNKDKWIAWRCAKIGHLYEKLSAILRTERADLILKSSIFSGKDTGVNAGIDPQILGKIDNVVLNDDCSYGRRGRGESSRLNMLRMLMKTTPQLDAIASGAGYFEATEKVIPPSALDFPETTKKTWMSAVVNASGRLMLERFALAVARADSLSLQDGGNAWTMGQPELRSFMKEYRVLPKEKFKSALCLDPVAVRQEGAYFYAVNMMPYPVECHISFAQPASVTALVTGATEDVSALKLDAYELRSFRTTEPITTVSIATPDNELKLMQEQLQTLRDSIAQIAPTHKEAVMKLLAACQNYMDNGQYWQFTATLRIAENELNAAGILLPGYYQDGLPITPADAMNAQALRPHAPIDATLVPSDNVIADWSNEQILTSKPGQPLMLKLTVPVTGYYHVRFGAVTGGAYGELTLACDDDAIGTVSHSGTQTIARDVQFAKPLALHDGEVTLSLTPEGGKSAGVSYLQLTPAYSTIPPMRWKVSDNLGKTGLEEPNAIETERDFTSWKTLEGFDPFVDISCGVPVQDGTIRYAVTFIHTPDARTIRLCYGIDYRAKMWLNGGVIKATGERRLKSGAPNRGEETLDVPLQQGWNELLLKISSGSGHNGFWMEVSNKNDLKFSADPKADDAPHAVVIPDSGSVIAANDFETEDRRFGQNWDGSGKESFTGNGAAQMGQTYLSGKVQGGKAYVLQAYLRSLKDGDKGRLQINWSSPENKLIKYDLKSPAMTTEYRRYQLCCKAPETATGAFIIVGTEKGREWVDDLWFGEVPAQ